MVVSLQTNHDMSKSTVNRASRAWNVPMKNSVDSWLLILCRLDQRY